jgi:hypothetical protein
MHNQINIFNKSCNNAGITLKGSRVPELQVLALTIFNSCRKNKIDIYTVWIPREQNVLVDYLNRIIDTDDWQTTVEFYSYLDSMWGPLRVLIPFTGILEH